MARLEIEIATVGAESIRAGSRVVNGSLSTMQTSLNAANVALSKANATARELEGELVSLNRQLSEGSISTQRFAQEQTEVFTALSSARTAAQGYQSQITSINATLNRGVTSTDNYGNSVQRLAGYHSDYSRGIRGASGVSLEFARIIQDAPYGIIGIGNNIQQLTSNYAIYARNLRESMAAQGQSITNFGVFRSAVGSLITPMSLLTIGISLATAAFTAYTLWSQKSAKTTGSTKKSADAYIETLNKLDAALLKGAQDGAREAAQLKVLYSLYQNANIPLNKRREAYKELQQQYPSYFGDLAFEETATKKTTAAYNSLTQSVIATAKAKALSARIGDSAVKQEEIANKIFKLSEDLKKSRASDTSIAGALGGSAETRKIIEEIYALDSDRLELKKEDLRVQEKINDLIGKENGNLGTGKNERIKRFANKSAGIVGKSDNSADLAGLEGVDKEVEQVRQKYIKLYADLDANAKKSSDARKTLETDMLRIQANEATEITRIIVAEKTREAEAIQAINDESGIKAAENIQKDLLRIDKWYNDRIIKARGNAAEIAAIESGKLAQIDAVYKKYNDKRVDVEQKIFDKINDVTEKGFTDNLKHTIKGSEKIDDQLKDRIDKLRKYFDELRKMNATNPLAQLALGIAENAQIGIVTSEANKAKNPKTDLAALFDQDLNNAVRKFGDDFVNTLKNINRTADETFGQVLGRLGTSLFESLGEATSDIFLNQFKTQFSDAIKGASQNLSTGLKGAIAGAGLLGGAISGLTKKTSGVGQGIGGALSGAATGAGAAIGIGAALGTAAGPIGIAIGAGIGGLVGLIGGIFGAKKARKEEAIQKAQLEEQKKQTALQERANALAYSASIIGQQTNQGIVTGVERDATGNLVAKIAGKDILITYDRAKQDQKRGI